MALTKSASPTETPPLVRTTSACAAASRKACSISYGIVADDAHVDQFDAEPDRATHRACTGCCRRPGRASRARRWWRSRRRWRRRRRAAGGGRPPRPIRAKPAGRDRPGRGACRRAVPACPGPDPRRRGAGSGRPGVAGHEDGIAFGTGVFLGDHGIGAARKHRTGHDAHCLAGADGARRRPCRPAPCRRWRAAFRFRRQIGGTKGVAVHRRVVVGGDIEGGDDIAQQHPVQGSADRHRLPIGHRRQGIEDGLSRCGNA